MLRRIQSGKTRTATKTTFSRTYSWSDITFGGAPINLETILNCNIERKTLKKI